MNLISSVKLQILKSIKNLFSVTDEQLVGVDFKLNVDRERSFGDLSCNAAMVLAKRLEKNPKELASLIQEELLKTGPYIKTVEIAGPGFINITFTDMFWQNMAKDLFEKKEKNFQLDPEEQHLRYNIEFVSANPTGPLHLGHGRGGIIGDTLARVLSFLGHSVVKEFYINDAGNQVELLGQSFKVRCLQELGQNQELPEGGYAGDYLVELAKDCIEKYGEKLLEKDNIFFVNFAKEKMLEIIKSDLIDYGIVFDEWFSEKLLHDGGAVDGAIELLNSAGLLYEKDGALWFCSEKFGDDKDRVIKKANGQLTYIAGDIAYHKNKFDRGYDRIINVLGQDHHGYVKRLKATMQALGFDSSKLDVILYQLVSIKKDEELVRMSKRAGTFTRLSEVIEAVGPEVARFFFLNRKVDAHLEFDLSVALKKSDENPVYYIQYAFVRTGSLLNKAKELGFLTCEKNICDKNICEKEILELIGDSEIILLKKIIFLYDVLINISHTHQMHVLSYYTLELATVFHNFYTNNRIIEPAEIKTTKMRLFMVKLVRDALGICLDLLGLGKPDSM